MSLEDFERLASGIKDALEATLVVCVAGFLFLLMFSTGVQHFVANAFASLSASGVKSFKIGELEIELKEAKEAATEAKQAAIIIANNPPAAPASQPRPAPQDKPPTPNLAPALQLVSTDGSFWTYLGQIQGAKFLHPPNFHSGSGLMPTEGESLMATTDVYERDAAPVPDGQEWKLGKIVGVVREGQRVIVRQVFNVHEGNIWLNATVVR
jgi:hypothetical protein